MNSQAVNKQIDDIIEFIIQKLNKPEIGITYSTLANLLML